MSLFGGLAALGLGGSLLGGLFGANSAADQARAANAAGAAARSDYQNVTDEGMLRQLAFALGPDEAERVFRGSGISQDRIDRLFGRPATPATANPGNDARIAEIQRQLGTMRPQVGRGTRDGHGSTNTRRGDLERELATLTRANGTGTPGVTGSMDVAGFNNLGPGYLSQMGDLADQFIGKGQSALTGYNLDTDRLMRGGDSLLSGLEGYGNQERTRITREAARGNRNADNASLAALSAAGLDTSTLRANQVSNNARRFSEQASDQTGALEDNLIRMRTGVKQGNLGMLASRLGGRTGLETSLNDQALSLKQAPLSARMSLLTGSTFNPWLGQNTTQYYPGVSPSAQFGSGLSSMLSGLGGQAAGIGMQGLLTPELLRLMQGMR